MLRRSSPDRRASRILVGVAAVAFGAALLGISTPIVVSSLITAFNSLDLKRLHRGEMDAPTLRRLIPSLESSADWWDAGRAYTDLALSHVVLGEYESVVGERNENLLFAENAMVKGLSRSPMNPYAWMRLAEVRMARQSLASEIAPPLKLALGSGPHEDRRDAMLLLVVEAGLYSWDFLPHHVQELIADKTREAWRRDALSSAAAAVRTGKMPLLTRLVGL